MASYDAQTTTTTTTSGIGFKPDYLRTIPGILKVVEIVTSVLVLICSSVRIWPGSGWTMFVSASALLSTTIFLVFYLMNFRPNFPEWWAMVEFIYYCFFTLFYAIAAIVCATKASWHASIGAATFFAFVATAVYAVDTFFQYRAWRTGQTEMTTTTHTTKTTTTAESHEQY